MKISARLAAFTMLAAIPAMAFAANDGRNRRVNVQNISRQAIFYLYASPVTSKTWEEDLLGSATISAGANRNANIDNGTNECNYDLKVVMADGKEYIHRGVNVCVVSNWVIGDSGDSIR